MERKIDFHHYSTWFYPAVLACWSIFVFVKFSTHTYFPHPFPSVAIDGSALPREAQLTRNSLDELLKQFMTEKNPDERKHICHNIGTSYYDIYRESGSQVYLDSAMGWVQQSIAMGKPVGRFLYNLGRIYTEFGAHTHAKSAYEQAIVLDPKNILSMHNLGLLTFFELKKPREASTYLKQALTIDSILPMCNLVLGLIDLDISNYSSAEYHLEKEITIGNSFLAAPRDLPITNDKVLLAQGLAHWNLSLLFSSKKINMEKAEQHFHAYLALETNPQKRQDAIQQMSRYWTMQAPPGETGAR